jgi:hypothetical protein
MELVGSAFAQMYRMSEGNNRANPPRVLHGALTLFLTIM